MRRRRPTPAPDQPKPAKDLLVAVYQDGALSVLFQAMQAWLARGDIKEAARTASMLLRALPEERPGAAFLDLTRDWYEDSPETFHKHAQALQERAQTARRLSM